MGFQGAEQWRAGLANEPGDYFNSVVLTQAAPASLDECYADQSWFTLFWYFCQSEFSTENVDFVVAVDDFVRSGSLPAAEHIYDTYVATNDVNISGPVKQALDTEFGARGDDFHCAPGVFDEARTEIFNLMRRDSFNRFQASVMDAQQEEWNKQSWDDVGTRDRANGVQE
jgi:hypothetical protein